MTVKFESINEPSRTKGWNRYQVTHQGAKIVQSATGNIWVSGSKSGEVAEGAELVLHSPDRAPRRQGPYRAREHRHPALHSDRGCIRFLRARQRRSV